MGRRVQHPVRRQPRDDLGGELPNVAILKECLEDSTTVQTTFVSQEGEPVFRVYFVRATAFEILKEWGIKIDEPVTRIPVEK